MSEEERNPAADGGARNVANAVGAGDAENTTTATPIQAPAQCTTSVGPRGADHRETSDTYRGELFRFEAHRVAKCRHGIQWLYQVYREASQGVGTAWETKGFCCTTRGALMRLHRSYTGAEAAEIAALPERISLGRRR